MDYEKRLNKLRAVYNAKVGEKQALKDSIDNRTREIQDTLDSIDIYKKTSLLLQSVSEYARGNVKQQLEQTVTSALQYISGISYRFEIDITELRGKPSAEYYVVEDIGAETSRQKPEDACGGGFVDIISAALRYAYLELFSAPKLQAGVLLDEPGKMIDITSSNKFAEFIKQLGQSFDRQTIMITHNDGLRGIADKLIEIQKSNSVSKVVTN